MGTEFSPQLLEDASAWLFWTLAANNGFRPTFDDILRTGGQSLLDCPNREDIFARYPLSDLSQKEFTTFCHAVAKHAWHRSVRKENLIGIIYIEDRLSGRAPSAANINTENWNLPLTIKGDTLPAYGTLCIRHPLPAVVFADKQPPNGFFRVADTSALGFNTSLWLSPQSAEQIADGLWLLNGIFHIPENLAIAGRPWTEVIPNAICALEGMMLGTVRLDFCWHNVDKEKSQPTTKTLTDKLRALVLDNLLSDQQR